MAIPESQNCQGSASAPHEIEEGVTAAVSTFGRING